jgi:LPXTG-motif cell wall-anchored protein
MIIDFLTRFAATYNCDSYGVGNYNAGGECAAALAGTGESLYTGIAIGVVLITIAIVLFVRMKRKK